MVMYKNQRDINKVAEAILPNGLPPSSAPTVALLIMRVTRQRTAQIKKTTTENPRGPAAT